MFLQCWGLLYTPLYGHAPSNPDTNKVLLMIMNNELQQRLGLVPNLISDKRRMWDLNCAIRPMPKG